MAILQATGVTGSLSISSSRIPRSTSASLFSVNGYNGRLINVVDSLSGSLFSVNSIAGLPIFEVFSNNKVVAGKYNANDFVISGSRVGIGTNRPGQKLDVTSGSFRVASGANSGEIYFGKNDNSSTGIGLIRDNSYDLSLIQNADSSRALYLAGAGNVYVSIDSNNNETDRAFIVQNNAIKAGTELFRIQENGNVGIGTTNPTSKTYILDSADSPALGTLRVRSTGGNSSICIDSNSTSQYSYFTLAQNGAGKFEMGIIPTTSDFYLNPNVQVGATNPAIFIKKADGNIGIATTSPGYKLDVTGDINFSSTLKFGGVSVVSNTATDVYVNSRVIRNDSTVNQDGMYIGYNNSGTTGAHLRFFANGTNERMRIQANDGNVGIGVASPSARLHLSSSSTTSLRIETKVNSGADSEIEFVGPDTHSYSIGIDESDSDKFKISYANSRTPPTLGTNDRFVIQTDGKIGIGTSVAETDLSVVDMNFGRVGIGTVTYYGVWLTGGTSATDFSFLSSPSDTNLYLNAPASRGIYNQINNTNILSILGTTIATSVPLGIAMTPSYTLDVTGTLRTSGDVGLGGAPDAAARLYVQGEALTEPFLSVQTCLGNNSTSTATYNVLKGYLAIKIGNNVGTSGNLITAGTYYLRLWGA